MELEKIVIWAPTEASRLGVGIGEEVEVSPSVAAEFLARGIASRPGKAVESAMTGPSSTATAPAGRKPRR